LRPITRYRMLGVHVDRMEINDLHRSIASAIRDNRTTVIGNHNLHSIYLFHRDQNMHEFYRRADLVHVDGMGVVLAAKLLGLPLTFSQRLAYLDFMPPVLQEAVQNRWRVFYLGCKPGVIDRGIEQLRRKHPGLLIAGTHGYFNPVRNSEECVEVLRKIALFKPHILVVGMGMPRQEQWIAENVDDISANVIFDAGGYLDYIAGDVPTTPRWVGKLYLEWLVRLCFEPKRLWRRYLVEPWVVAALLVRAQWDRTLAAEIQPHATPAQATAADQLNPAA